MRKHSWCYFVLPVAWLLYGACAAANPYDWSVRSSVTRIEVTYMPDEIVFALEAPAGPCPSGHNLRYTPAGADVVSKASNAKAVLAVLLAAKTSGQHVLVYGSNQGCQARFVYIN